MIERHPLPSPFLAGVTGAQAVSFLEEELRPTTVWERVPGPSSSPRETSDRATGP